MGMQRHPTFGRAAPTQRRYAHLQPAPPDRHHRGPHGQERVGPSRNGRPQGYSTRGAEIEKTCPAPSASEGSSVPSLALGAGEARTTMEPFLLSIDQGTTSTRAVVYDGAARVRGSAALEFTQHFPQPGWV